VREFSKFVISAAKICKQRLQTASASGGLRKLLYCDRYFKG